VLRHSALATYSARGAPNWRDINQVRRIWQNIAQVRRTGAAAAKHLHDGNA